MSASHDDPAPTDLRSGERSIRLKWHQVRRRAADPPFARRSIVDGLAAGASIEVDIRPLACGNWVVLHDPMLEDETTGAGAIADATADDVRNLRMREGGEPVLLLDELVALVRESHVAPGALLQLDFQTTGVTLDAKAVDTFAGCFAEEREHCIVSGYDWNMIRTLGDRVDGLALGWDPSLEAPNHPGAIFELIRDTAPEAEMIYLHRALIRLSHQNGERLVERLAECDQRVDCWTVDHGAPDAVEDLRAAIATGCFQVTTNTALDWTARATESYGGDAQR